MRDGNTDWPAFHRKWPWWRLCVCAAFFAHVAWAVLVAHPVRWFVFPAVVMAVMLAHDLAKARRGG
jgi:hypothetical protein